jgi:NitT/TauT family transport system substrate-binding protein
MQTFSKPLSITALVALLAFGMTSTALAAPKSDFKVAWSIYVGWMPWGYAADKGIVKKWADKYGLKIEVTQFNDYVESWKRALRTSRSYFARCAAARNTA